MWLCWCILLLAGCSTPFSSKQATPVATLAAVTPAATPATTATASPAATPSVPPSGTPTVISAATPTAKPQPRGAQTLTLTGSVEDPTTLDPALVREASAAFIDQQIFRGLVHLNSDLTVSPDLAQTIDVAPDHQIYTFHLYSGLTFQSGRPLQAADVKYSLERATDPALAKQSGQPLPAAIYLSDIQGASERLQGTSSPLTGVEVLDPLTVRITLTHPTADFLQKLTGLPAAVVSHDNVEQGGEWWRQPDGSGPFKLTGWKSGAQLVLSGVASYRPQPPTLKTVTILLGASAEQPVALYERDQIDVAPVSDDVLPRVLTPGTPLHDQLQTQPTLGGEYVFLNPNVPPFADPKLRQALIQGFDRSKIANVTFEGHVSVLDGIVPVTDDDHTWAAQLPPYDLASAKELYQQATDQARAQPLTLYTAGSWTPAAMKEVYQRDLGINAEVVDLDWSDYIQRLGKQNMGMFSLNWIADYPDPGSVLWSLFASTSPDNPIGYHNPEVDRLLARAEAEPDPQRRIQLYRQAQQLIVDDNVVIPIYRDTDYELVKPRVHGLQFSPLGMLGLETVWIAG
ncbi:MAG TPA: peptide ABC transporter substrate-binding protein [Thermomicrobiaceae bacterium]|nr:peptide ABC transporter substrate-binding protein [Thermomicrobiaceae bacterium]